MGWWFRDGGKVRFLEWVIGGVWCVGYDVYLVMLLLMLMLLLLLLLSEMIDGLEILVGFGDWVKDFG